jgi:cell division septum initiation protein DivIVA
VSARQFRQGIKDLKAEVVKVNDKVGNLKDEVVKIEARLTASATKDKEELIAAATKDKEELTKALKKTEDKLTAKNEELSKDISKTAFVTGNIITGGSILVALLTLLSNFDCGTVRSIKIQRERGRIVRKRVAKRREEK